MASRMLHYLTGLQAAGKLCLQEPERFMIGNMLPDCVEGPGGRRGEKGVSHFFVTSADGRKKGSDWRLFLGKYRESIGDELYLGYLCHLVTDAVWVHDVYRPSKGVWESKVGSDAALAESQAKLYRDYHRLNGLLRRKYALVFPELPWPGNAPKEVRGELWGEYVRSFREEFYEDERANGAELELLSYEKIRSFIERAAKTAASEVEAGRDGRAGIAPERYFVPV